MKEEKKTFFIASLDKQLYKAGREARIQPAILTKRTGFVPIYGVYGNPIKIIGNQVSP
jgi:hypothetical protein